MSSLLAAKLPVSTKRTSVSCDERPRAVAGDLVGRRLRRPSSAVVAVVALELAVLEVGAEVQLVAAHQRRVDRARGADPAVIVEAGVDRVGGEQAGVERADRRPC